jgi:hypothetical protein
MEVATTQEPITIKNSKLEVTDGTVIIMIWKVVQNMRERGDDMTLECIQNE